MAIRTLFRVLVTGLAFSAVCGAQSKPAQKSSSAPCPAASQTSSQSAAKACAPAAAADGQQPSAAQQFPFPGEASPPAAPPAAPSASHPSAASDHPYPGDPGAGSGSSSSSSSSDDGYVPPTNLSTRRKLPKVQKVQTPDQRVDEDLRVSKFYLDADDLPGAYLRAKDAVRVEPDYSETHFMLAEVAQKMKKKQEAVAEFQTYLKLDPEGQRTKAAKRALAELK